MPSTTTTIAKLHILTKREKLIRYNQILDLLSQVNFTLLDLHHPTQNIYNQTNIVECMIYTEMKKIEADLENDYSEGG